MWVLNHTMHISGIWISFPVTEPISFGASIILLMIYNRKKKTSSPLESSPVRLGR